MPQWKEILKTKFGNNCFFNEPLAPYTTYKIGGLAECFVLPEQEDDIAFILKTAQAHQVPFVILGMCSNVLISDKGIAGITVSTRKMMRLDVEGKTVTAQCGAMLDKIILSAVEHGLSGMEKMSGIPGSVGGAVWMNAGAFGHETFDALVKFTVINLNGDKKEIKKDEVKYGYRKVDGIENLIILSAQWHLEYGDKKLLSEEREKTLQKRTLKQPLEYPSAGSVFKRPVGDFASRLIEVCGLKGVSVGGAEVSSKHAGFIINKNRATAKNVFDLMRKVQSEVKNKAGVELELEQILLGDFC